MKITNKRLTACAVAAVICGPLAMGHAFAHEHEQEKKVREESSEHARQRVHKQRQVSGTILETKEVKFKGTDQENTVALLRTNKNDRRLVVDLGPKDEVKALNLKKGQQLAAKGVVTHIGDKQVLIADEIKHGAKTMNIDRMPELAALRREQSQAQSKGQALPGRPSGGKAQGQQGGR